MLKRLFAWLKARRLRSSMPAEPEARRDAKRIEDEIETTRIEERRSSSHLTGR
jgi:hypothetical protein